MRERVRKGNVGLASAGKVREQFDGVADVHDDEEWRPSVGYGESFGILLGLVAGAEHSFVPAWRSADAGTTAAGSFKEEARFGRFAALLGFQDEAAALVRIDEASAGRAAGMPESYWPFEYIVVLAIVGDGGIGTGDIEVVAQFGEK
jgi:hypothetical protein